MFEREPHMDVGILDAAGIIEGEFRGEFQLPEGYSISGPFSVADDGGSLELRGGDGADGGVGADSNSSRQRPSSSSSKAMDIFTLLQNLLSDYTLRTVALGAGVLGIVSGALGSYAVLRKQALLGDAVSHAALPGIAIAIMLTGSKAPLVLVLGAAIAGWLATLLMISIVKTTRLKDDSVLGLLLSVFFGFGLVLLTFIQRTPNAAKAGLDKFLFGQAATLLASDVITMSVVGLIVLLLVAVLWKEFKLLSFDPAFGASLGFRMRFLDVALTTLIVVAIVDLGIGVTLLTELEVPHLKIGRQCVYDVLDLDAWLDQYKQRGRAGKEVALWPVNPESINGQTRAFGGLLQRFPTEGEYAKALGLKTGRTQKRS